MRKSASHSLTTEPFAHSKVDNFQTGHPSTPGVGGRCGNQSLPGLPWVSRLQRHLFLNPSTSPEFMQTKFSLLEKLFSGESRSVFSFPEINTFVYPTHGTFISPESNTVIQPQYTKVVLSTECLSLEDLITINIFRSTMMHVFLSPAAWELSRVATLCSL